MIDRWQELTDAVEPHRRRVLEHEVYKRLDSLDALRIFMVHHVWAVWDFMSLLTALQRAVTCTTVPWTPAIADVAAARFVNEIKLGEESDTHPAGGWTSHFDLYVEAMRELGADPGPIVATVRAVREIPTADVPACAVALGAPRGAGRFVGSTLRCATTGTLPEVAAAFALGREQLIPDMFRPLLAGLGYGRLFEAYLERHVELDEGEHGPLAHRLVQTVCGADPEAWQRARSAAIAAVSARHRLWDDTLAVILGR